MVWDQILGDTSSFGSGASSTTGCGGGAFAGGHGRCSVACSTQVQQSADQQNNHQLRLEAVGTFQSHEHVRQKNLHASGSFAAATSTNHDGIDDNHGGEWRGCQTSHSGGVYGLHLVIYFPRSMKYFFIIFFNRVLTETSDIYSVVLKTESYECGTPRWYKGDGSRARTCALFG